jgi:hypothetical protein
MQRSESALNLYCAANSLHALDLASSVDYTGGSGMGSLVHVGKAPTRLSARGPIDESVRIRLSHSSLYTSSSSSAVVVAVAVAPVLPPTPVPTEVGPFGPVGPVSVPDPAAAVKEEKDEKAAQAVPGGHGAPPDADVDADGDGYGLDDDDSDSEDVHLEAL